MGVFITIFYEPILGGKLELKWDFTSDQVAYFYSIFTISSFCSNLYLTLFPLKKNFLLWITVSSVISILALFLMGPSRLFRIPDSLIIMGIGMGILGLSSQVYGVVIIILILEPLQRRFPD